MNFFKKKSFTWRLEHSEQEQLKAIEMRLASRCSIEERPKLEQKRLLIKKTYALQICAEQALSAALASSLDVEKWHKAYEAAEEADVSIRLLLASDLYDFFNPEFNIYKFGNVYNIQIVVALSLLLLNWKMGLFDQYPAFFIVSLMLPMLFSSALSRFTLPLAVRLMHRLTNDVIDAAPCPGILTKTTGAMVLDSDSLISKVMSSATSQHLSNEFDTEFPIDFCCSISLMPMTDPVYTNDCPYRFDMPILRNWLKIKATHPGTNLPFAIEDLKRDFPLKVKINRYIEEQLIKKQETESDNTYQLTTQEHASNQLGEFRCSM